MLNHSVVDNEGRFEIVRGVLNLKEILIVGVSAPHA